MAKTAILMPYAELKAEAEAMIAGYPRIKPMCVEFVETDQISRRCKALEAEGCEMIIARGLQARIARDSVVIPVIEMRASTQELESLVLALARQVPGKPDGPVRLGIIGFFNMFHSMDLFNEAIGPALNVDLRIYMATDIAQYPQLVDKAHAEHCDGVIGGEMVGRRAHELGLRYAFLSMGEESMREVLETASRVAYSIDLMRSSSAEMSVMLDNTFSAIMQVDKAGVVMRANRACYELLGKQPDQVIGQPATAVVDGLEPDVMAAALTEGRETDLIVTAIQHRTVLVNLSPVRVDDQVSMAILTFQEGQLISKMDSQLRQDLARHGYVAHYEFKDLETRDAGYQEVLNQARKLAKHRQPVLLVGESGVGKGMIAQCMHNASLRRENAFVTFDCSVWHPDDMDEKLFGRFSARKDAELSTVEYAKGGTLYIRNPELMSIETQYKLLQLAGGRYLHNSSSESSAMDVRLIISTEASLKDALQQGALRRDLYYTLCALKLLVPPLRRRRQDILPLFTAMLAEWGHRFKRSMSITPDAAEFLTQYGWPGNIDQLNSLCKRLVLLAESRSLTESALRKHLAAMEQQADAAQEDASGTMDSRAKALMDLLIRCRGNREKAAAELGISKTTLWRRMKQYGIDRNLTFREPPV